MDFKELQQLLMDASSPGIKPGLARLSLLCQSLDHPERSFRAVQVTGTNGKGSTAAYMSQIFEEAGYHCALYTSPHLEDFSERLLVRGRPLPVRDWERSVGAVMEALAAEPGLRSAPPTFFELLTATAFHLIREQGVPFVILEAGMGGRLDATNILPPASVLMNVITSVGKDHADFLGDSLAQIAEEKFTVVSPDRPALFSGDPLSLISQFRTCCRRVKAVPHILTEEWSLQEGVLSLQGGEFTLVSTGEILEIQTPLLGRHQILNAALAAASCQILSTELPGLTRDAIVRGIGNTRWSGRLEVLDCEPPILLDGGHNAHAVERVVASIREMKHSGGKIGLVYATMEDKDFPRSLSLLRGLSDEIFCTEIPGNPRSLSSHELANAAEKAGFKTAIWEPDPLVAVGRAQDRAELVLCLGSLYLVGWLKQRL